MSRRKVRGLTRTGRQVSEDPDIDNLLSTLSPEEVEELEKEVMTVPDTDPNETLGFTPGCRLEKQPSLNNNTEAKQDQCETKRLPRRELSVEGEPKKESRKQEYLRKMGLSQEGSLPRSASQDGGPQRQGSVSSEGEHNKMEDRNCREPGDLKENRRTPLEKTRREGIRDGEKGNEREEESKKKAENNSKTKELISKLQEKKEEGREKERREEGRKREEGKTKELISRLHEKKEKEESKEKERKDEMRWKDDRKTRGLVSRLEEKQSPGKEDRAEVKKDRVEGKSNSEQWNELQERERDKPCEKEEKEKEKRERDGGRDKESERGERKAAREEKEKEEKEKKQKENTKEKERDEKERGKDREKESGKEKPSRLSTTEKAGNDQSPVSKPTEEEEDDEASSMFDELLEQVRSNDPAMTELNVNNSEVIKAQTLIQFAEALRDNTHVKTFALANTRADDHVAYAIAGTLRANKTIASVNLDSNHLTSKGIMALVQALQHNGTLAELRFHNQRHICGGKTEMEMAKVLKDNTTLLKLGYHFELAGPRMTVTNILSRNMDRQRQRRLQEQKQAQANGEKKGGGALEVPKPGGAFLRGSPRASPKASPLPSPLPSPIPSPKVTPKRGGGRGGGGVGGGGVGGGAPPPPAPPPPPPAPLLDGDFLRNSLSPASQRKLDDRGAGRGGGKNSRDQLLASIRSTNVKQLKKVTVPKLLQ
ncbi:leiomodin-1 [Anguilla anguilla]|uniref:leiomodin-1 n=1 Tax=Anguilla anguilla TaxID=7936 RepID=UPI0015AACE2F|nr:leiomodin-1 [Anguilla anguilla]